MIISGQIPKLSAYEEVTLQTAFFSWRTRSRGMASKGLRATFLSTITKFEAECRASQTTETLISYTVCWQIVHINQAELFYP